MCGRFTLRAKPKWIAEDPNLWDALEVTPRYNIAPTQVVAALRVAETGAVEVAKLRWGLLPAWVKDPKKFPLLINAQSETVAEKPAFRSAFRRRRCLILADGYYEWKAIGKKKQPYFYRLKTDEVFAFAGLWESRTADETVTESCTILTTEANELARAVHTRMPVILGAKEKEIWLDHDIAEPKALLELLRPCPDNAMLCYPVNPIVNRAAVDSLDCITPVPEPQAC
jgi:putative SOS response-associated peptidase YedK